MFDYLMINGNFKGKRATYFKIYKTNNDDVERDFQAIFLYLVDIFEEIQIYIGD